MIDVNRGEKNTTIAYRQIPQMRLVYAYEGKEFLHTIDVHRGEKNTTFAYIDNTERGAVGNKCPAVNRSQKVLWKTLLSVLLRP